METIVNACVVFYAAVLLVTVGLLMFGMIKGGF